MSYAVIAVGGKQYRVQEGERLVVDRVRTAEGKQFHPAVLVLGQDGGVELAPKSAQVTARVLSHSLGDKIRIGKYRPKKGYRRHQGFRARVSQIELESIGKKAARKKAASDKEAPAEKAKSTSKKEG